MDSKFLTTFFLIFLITVPFSFAAMKVSNIEIKPNFVNYRHAMIRIELKNLKDVTLNYWIENNESEPETEKYIITIPKEEFANNIWVDRIEVARETSLNVGQHYWVYELMDSGGNKVLSGKYGFEIKNRINIAFFLLILILFVLLWYVKKKK